MKYEIKNRFTGEIQFTAEIDCAEDAPTSVKVGLAVKWAFGARANLAGANLAHANLDGAYLAGANLAHANLDGAYLADAYLDGANLAHANLADANLAHANLAHANLDGAYLARANLDGAYLDGAKVERIITRVGRSDGYEFIAFATDHGVIIRAGCRTMNPAEYREHVASEYPGTDKARETLDILDFIEKRAKP